MTNRGRYLLLAVTASFVMWLAVVVLCLVAYHYLKN